jgi:hypothetical protein
VPVLIGILLLVASMLKAHQLATQELPERSILTTRWFLVGTVVFELGFGLWLISGFHERITRWAAVATFAVFFEGSLYLFVIDAPSCGCFGRITVLPWQAMLIDLGGIGLLLAWRPAGSLTVFTHPRWLFVLGLAYVTVAAPVVISVLDYAPQGPMAGLRNDLRLAKTVPLHLKNATLPEVLEKLHKATGLTFTISEALAAPVHLGEVQTEGAQAWAVLEWLAVSQPLPARWEKTADGYQLVRAAPLGVTFPWAFAGLTLVIVTLAAAVVRTQQPKGTRLVDRPVR